MIRPTGITPLLPEMTIINTYLLRWSIITSCLHKIKLSVIFLIDAIREFGRKWKNLKHLLLKAKIKKELLRLIE